MKTIDQVCNKATKELEKIRDDYENQVIISKNKIERLEGEIKAAQSAQQVYEEQITKASCAIDNFKKLFAVNV